MDRRRFLGSALYFTVASAASSLAACGSQDPGEPAPPPGSHSFPQGVASGDPRESSLVFWTRCLGPAQDGVDLLLEVAPTPAFDRDVAALRLTALPAWDYTVRAKLTQLLPGTAYYYRFTAGQDRSPVGQARTAPALASSPDQLRFAWINCQDWSVNHWGAFELLAGEDVDFVVHVGDYVYESVDAVFQAGKAEPAHAHIALPDGEPGPGGQGGIHAVSLADYRTLYRTYRGDPRLQEVHRRFPMVATWDDHEFSDDCWQDHETYDNANLRQVARRRAASQAWAEYMPVDWGDVSFDPGNPAYDNIRIWRELRFGTLVHLVMTDERLYRDDHVVSESALARLLGHDPVHGDDSLGARYFVARPVLQEFERIDTLALGRAPSILGPAQAQWWKDTMAASPARWKVWGNEVTLNRMWLDLARIVPAPFDQQYVLNADAWDGYPAARAELMGFLKAQGVANVVAISGDLHSFQCGVVRDNPDPALGTPVMVDFLSAGISSGSFYSYLKLGAAGTPLTRLVQLPELFDSLMRSQNPDLAYADHNAQGYAVATVTQDAFTVLFNKVNVLNPDGTLPANLLAKRTRITLAAGSTAPLVEDEV